MFNKKIPIHWQIFIAIFFAFIFGIYLKEYVNYVEWMGRGFMHLIKLVIIPLVMMAIISGVSNLGLSGNLGRVGIRTIAFYSTTTIVAVLTGLMLVNLIQPGIGVQPEALPYPIKAPPADFIPDNFIKALYDGNMMVIVFSALLFGFFITKIEEKSRERLSSVFNSFFDVMMRLTQWLIKFSPYGIFGIIVPIVAKQDNVVDLFSKVFWYATTVLLALAVHVFITLPMLVRFWGNAKPFKLFNLMSTPLITAFTTCSSGAALPYTMDAVENKVGVSKKITGFVIPLGGTMNFDGTALYECVAALFIAQVYGVDLSLADQGIVVLMSLMVSFAGAAVPMAGLFMMPVVLHAVGLPMEGIGLIMIVDRFLDMARTTLNVWSDCCGAVIVAKNEGETLNV